MSTVKRPVLQRFVDDYPDKAVDVLMKACHDKDIEKEIVQFLLDPDQPSKNQSVNTSDIARVNSAHATPIPKHAPGSQRTGSFSGHRRQVSRPGIGLNAEPPSPPKTRSNHSKSLASKEGIENILFLTMDEDDEIKKCLATMKPAPIEHSVIGEHIFSSGRIYESEIEEIEELQISVPRRGVQGAFVNVTVSSYAELTWKRMRSTSKASHSTIFYIVPQEFLDIDVLLGSLDSGEDLMPSPPQRGPGLNFKEHFHNSAGQNSHAQSYHRSDNTKDGSSHSNSLQPDEYVQSFLRNQHEQNAAQARQAPTTTPDQRTEASRNPHTSTAESSSSTFNSNQNAGSDTIRVSCALGPSKIKFFLDLDGSAQAFLTIFQSEIEKKKKPFDQTKLTIHFHRERQMTDDDACESLSLAQNALEADWKETMAWIKENRRAEAPQIFATVQFDED